METNPVRRELEKMITIIIIVVRATVKRIVGVIIAITDERNRLTGIYSPTAAVIVDIALIAPPMRKMMIFQHAR